MLWVVLSFLSVAFLIQIFGRNIKGRLGTIFFLIYFAAIVFVFFSYLFITYLQYISWAGSSGVTKYFLPPYRDLSYLFRFHFVRFLVYYIISFLASLSFLILALTANKRFGGKFFEKEEPFIASLAVFLLGDKEWGFVWFYYIISILVFYFALHLYFRFKGFKNERVSMYWLWLPLSLSIIILRSIL